MNSMLLFHGLGDISLVYYLRISLKILRCAHDGRFGIVGRGEVTPSRDQRTGTPQTRREIGTSLVSNRVKNEVIGGKRTDDSIILPIREHQIL